MAPEIDELLTEIMAISRELDDPNIGASRRRQLNSRRDALRATAQKAADATRHPRSVEAEIEMLESRLTEIGRMQISKGHSEKYLGRTIQDPSAYSLNINRTLADQHEAEVADITARLAHLRTLELPHDHAHVVDDPGREER